MHKEKEVKKSLFRRFASAVTAAALGFSAVSANVDELKADAATVYTSNPYVTQNANEYFAYHYGLPDLPEGVSAFCLNWWSQAVSGDVYKHIGDGTGSAWYLNNAKARAVGILSYYGYPQHMGADYYAATQALVWEIASGDRDANTWELKSNLSMDNMRTHLTPARAQLYDQILDNAKKHDKKSTWHDTESVMTYNHDTGLYETTIYDTNKLTGTKEYKFDLAKALGQGFTVKVNPHKNDTPPADNPSEILVTATPAAVARTHLLDGTQEFTIEKSLPNLPKEPTRMEWVVQTRNPSRSAPRQEMGYITQVDPVKAKIKLGAERGGEFTFNKVFVDDSTGDNREITIGTSEYSTLANGVSFTIRDFYNDRYVSGTQTAQGAYEFNGYTTNVSEGYFKLNPSTGKFKIANLPEGTYVVHEVMPLSALLDNNTYKPDGDKTFTIKNGGTASEEITNKKSFDNYVDSGLTKIWQDPDGTMYSSYEELAAKFGTAYANEIYNSIVFRASVKVGTTTYYLTNLTQTANGDATIRSNNDGEMLANQFTTNAQNATFFNISNRNHVVNILRMTKEIEGFGAISNGEIKWEEMYSGAPAYAWITKGVKATSANIGETIQILNTRREFRLQLNKRTNRNGQQETNADNYEPVEGAVFEVYENLAKSNTTFTPGNKIATLTTHGDGKTDYVYIPFPTVAENTRYCFMYREVSVPDGVVLDPNWHSINSTLNYVTRYNRLPNADASGSIKNPSGTSNTSFGLGTPAVVNAGKTGRINIAKDDETGSVVSGISFNIINNNDWDVVYGGNTYAKNAVITTVVTNAQGKATVEGLPLDVDGIGSYIVKETGVYQPYVVMSGSAIASFDASGSEATVTYVDANVGVRNKLQKVNLKLVKTDKDTSAPIPNAVFTVTFNKDFAVSGKTIAHAGDVVGTLTTDAEGKAHSWDLAGGSADRDGEGFYLYPTAEYKISETTVPTGYKKMADKTFVVPFNNAVDLEYTDYTLELTNDKATVPVEVVKIDKNTEYPLAGGVFSLFAAENIPNKINGNTYASGAKIAEATTGADGKATFSVEVPVGYKYTITETKAPAGYVISDPASQTFQIPNNQTLKVTKTFGDTEQNAEINIVKNDEVTGTGVAGAEFTLYAAEKITYSNGTTRYNNGAAIQTVTTGADGKAKFNPVPAGFKYTVKETKAPVGYNLTAAPQTFTVERDANATVVLKTVTLDAFTDAPQNGKITIIKKDRQTETPLAGVEFGLYANDSVTVMTAQGKKSFTQGQLIESQITNAEGKAVFSSVPSEHSYYVQEIAGLDNYLVSTEKYEFTIDYDETVQAITKELTVYNDWELRPIEVNKKSANGKNLAGAVFALYAGEDVKLADNSILYHKDEEIQRVTTDESGKATTQAVPVGYNYYIKEITAPQMYVNNGQTQRFLVAYNATATSVIADPVTKTFTNDYQQAEISVFKTDGVTNRTLAGAEFALIAAEDIYGDSDTAVYTNGQEIQRVTTGADGKATFSTRVPVGYSYKIIETAFPEGYAPKEINDTFEIGYNPAVEFVSITREYTNDWQEGEITVKKFDAQTNTPLAGAEFTLYANEDIVRDGNTVYTAGQEIQKVTTGDDGSAKFDRVPASFEYKVVETKAPANYVNKHEEKVFRLEYSATVEFVSESADWLNDWQKGEVKIFKYTGADRSPLAGAEFVLTAVDDVKLADGTVLYASGTEIQKVTTDETGFATFDRVPVSYRYSVAETKAPRGYKRDRTVYEFVLEYAQDLEFSSVQKDVENKEIAVEISKRDMTDNSELAGAELKVVDSEGNTFDSWTSNGTNHVVHRIPAGTYTLVETSAPEGYATATSIEFAVDEDGNVNVHGEPAVTTDSNNPLIVMVDDVTKIDLSKQDITTGEEIPGATIVVRDSHGNEVDRWTSTNKPHRITKLKVGERYSMHEEIAPDGYLLNESDVSFIVDDTGKVQAVKMKDDYTKLEISKQDITTGEEIPGAKLQIIDSEGEVVREWTTTGEKTTVERIPTGTYILREITAPDGYLVAEDVTFTVTETGEVQKVVMKDKYTKVFIKKTDITETEEIPGAQLEIYDENGNKVAEWTSNGSEHEIDRLPAGHYKLVEKRSPDGYAYAEEVEFDVNENQEITQVTMKDKETHVEFTKTDITGQKELEGATLQILDGETVVEEWVSETTPHVVVKKLVAGKTYKLHETYAPEGYLVSEDDVEFTVSRDGRVDKVTMKDNYENGSIKVKKVTEEQKHIENIEFTLTGTSFVGVEVNETKTTDANGECKFVNIPTGHYVLKENAETVFDGYITHEDMNVDVRNGEETTVTVENAERKGKLKVQKRTEGMINLEGIEFVLSGTSDTGRTIKLSAVTDSNGVAEFDSVPVGTYIISEKDSTVPEYYLVADEQEVTITEAQTTNVTITNVERSGKLKIQKRTEGNLNLSGIEFILSGTSDSGREVELRATTDENGVAEFSAVPVGTYVITENGETVPAAYMVCDPTEVNVYETQTTNIEIRNEERVGSIKIQKRTEGMINLGGIEFVLFGTSDSGREIERRATTDDEGVATFGDIPVGTYQIRENAPDSVTEFYLVADDTEVTVIPATTTTVEITNRERSGKIQITKQTQGNLNIANIRFYVRGTADNGREVNISAITDENGIAVFENVPVGVYTIHEDGSTVPIGYLTANDTNCEVTFAQTTNVTVTNEEKCGSIRIQKRTADMTNIAGIRFNLSGIADNGRAVSLSTTTDANGVAEFGSVPEGTYTITEDGSTVPTAYMVADSQTVTVTYAQTTNVTFMNNKKPETPNTPNTPGTPSTPNPKTGTAGMVTAAGLGIVALAVARKRKEKESEEE